MSHRLADQQKDQRSCLTRWLCEVRITTARMGQRILTVQWRACLPEKVQTADPLTGGVEA